MRSCHGLSLECLAAQLKEIAPEFYDTLTHHTSWVMVMWAFLSDPEVGPWTRMKRTPPVGTPAKSGKNTNGVPLPPPPPFAAAGCDFCLSSRIYILPS